MLGFYIHLRKVNKLIFLNKKGKIHTASNISLKSEIIQQ